MSTRLCIDILEIILPADWSDITRELPNGSPYTVARADGVGALQFSIARYHGGVRPGISSHDLRMMIIEFSEAHGLKASSAISDGLGVHPFAVADFSSRDETIRAWYLTNGKDVVLATYVAQRLDGTQVNHELQEADGIVASLTFRSALNA